ncbi:class V aminotransferase [Sphingomonas ginkgonis]|uniref:Class V aminotransferase n=1 Tax=Sphingomonas ginkgonis TaxID=2315330 RepID=A0A429V6Y4_9SPHN|nr:class V aminotransferase [Sphingomonas ginkgonis]RST29726.1 class V aminotransferase [Sphingomonas ginkgonis]
MSFKPLFARSLAADPDRLHFAAHSHHLWPDASREGQIECWDDAARLADRKWKRVMGEIWSAAQAEVAAELGTGQSDAVVFAANTHDFLVRLWGAAPRRAGGPLRILTSDGEFHSARRQFARWAEEGSVTLDVVAAEPFDDFANRFLARAAAGEHDLILVSHVLFGSGRVFAGLEELARLADPAGPWVVVDGYHAFMALDAPLTPALGERLFYLGGGYKYAMSGEGMGFLHCPPEFGARPPLTGWYAEFEDLTLPPGQIGYAPDAMRFMGATFDPSALYRFLAVRGMLAANGLTTARISGLVRELQQRLIDELGDSVLGTAELLNPTSGEQHARFLALRSPAAKGWCDALSARNIVTDVRGDVLRIGFGLYQDEADVDLLLEALRNL